MGHPALDRVSAALADALRDHGWQITESPARVRAALGDLLGADADELRGLIAALVISAEEGVPEALRQVGGDPAMATTQWRRLQEWGLAPDVAEWVVSTWLRLLPPRTVPPPVTDAPVVTPPPDTPEPSVSEPEPPVRSLGVPVAMPLTALPEGSLTLPEPTTLPEPELTTLPESEPESEPVLKPTTLPDDPRPVAVTELPPTGGPHSSLGSGPPRQPEPQVQSSPPRQPAPSVGGTTDESAPGRGRLILAGGLVALLIAGASAYALTRGGDSDKPAAEDTTSQTSGESSASGESGQSDLPEVTAKAGSITSVPGLTLEPVDGERAMAARTTGVRLAALQELDSYDTDTHHVVAPEGGRLIAFQIAEWGCDAPPCRSWPGSGLKVSFGGTSRALPGGEDTYVVGVPSGADAPELVLNANGVTQTLSLADGAPGPDNLSVLARGDREETLDKKLSVTESYDVSGLAPRQRNGIVRSASLRYFWSGLEAKGPDRALLVVNTWFTRPGNKTSLSWYPEEVRLRLGKGGPLLSPLDVRGPKGQVNPVFDVPADYSSGTLEIGGSHVYSSSGTSITISVSSSKVPISIPR